MQSFEGFEVVSRLNQLVDNATLPESDLEVLGKAQGMDLGRNLKTRLNYLSTLWILRRPEPVYYGKGKGGTRAFQRDTLEALTFVDENKENFSLNEIAEVVRERREDLAKQACKEVKVVEDIPDSESFLKTLIPSLNIKCVFSYDLVKGEVVGLKITVLNNILSQLDSELTALSLFKDKIGNTFTSNDKAKTVQYIRDKQKQRDKVFKALKTTIDLGKDLIQKIEAEEY